MQRCKEPIVWPGSSGAPAAPGSAARASGTARGSQWVQEGESEDEEFDEVAQESGDGEGKLYEDEHERYDEDDEQQYEYEQYGDEDGEYAEDEHEEDAYEEDGQCEEEDGLHGCQGGRLVASVDPTHKAVLGRVVDHTKKGNDYKIAKDIQAGAEQHMRHSARLAARTPLQRAFAKDVAANEKREVEKFDNVRRMIKSVAERQRELVMTSIINEACALFGYTLRSKIEGKAADEERQKGEGQEQPASRPLDDFEADFVKQATAHRASLPQARARQAPTPGPRAHKPALNSDRLQAPLFAALGVGGALGPRPASAGRVQRKRPAAAGDGDAAGDFPTAPAEQDAQDAADILAQAAGGMPDVRPAKPQRSAAAAALERSHSAPPVTADEAEGAGTAAQPAVNSVFNRLSGMGNGSGAAGAGAKPSVAPVAKKAAAGAQASATAAGGAVASGQAGVAGPADADAAQPAAPKAPQQQRQRQRQAAQDEDQPAGASSSKAASADADDAAGAPATAASGTTNSTRKGAASAAKAASAPKNIIRYQPPGSRSAGQQEQQEQQQPRQAAATHAAGTKKASASTAAACPAAPAAAPAAEPSAAAATKPKVASKAVAASPRARAPAAASPAAPAAEPPGAAAVATKPKVASKAVVASPSARASVHSRLGTAGSTAGANGHSNGDADADAAAQPSRPSVLQRLGGDAKADTNAAPAAAKAAAATVNGTSRPSVLDRLGEPKAGAAADKASASNDEQNGGEAGRQPLGQLRHKRRASEGAATERRSGVFGVALLSMGMSAKKQRLAGGSG